MLRSFRNSDIYCCPKDLTLQTSLCCYSDFPVFQQRTLDGNLSFKYKHPSSVSNQIVEETVKYASSLCWNLLKETMNSHFLGCIGRILNVTLVQPHQEDRILVPPAKHRWWISEGEDHGSGSWPPEIWTGKPRSNCSWSNPRTPGPPSSQHFLPRTQPVSLENCIDEEDDVVMVVMMVIILVGKARGLLFYCVTGHQ